jgi:aminopeptidase-like protein
VYQTAIEILETNSTPQAVTVGEPQLSSRGLYPRIGTVGTTAQTADLLNVWTFCDGGHDSVSIAEETGLKYSRVRDIVKVLADSGLVKNV